MEMQTWDVAVIGGGAAGLTAAAYAARAGKRVVLLEKASNYGGRAASIQNGGAVFNLGPHAFYRTGHAARVLAEFGISLSGKSPGPNIWWVPSLNEGKIVSTVGMLAGRTLEWSQKGKFLRMALGVRKWQPEEAVGKSWSQFMDEGGLRERARGAMSALARLGTYTGDISRLDAGTAIRQMQMPIIYPDGGWESIVQSLRKAAEDAGAVLRNSAGVERAMYSTEGWTLETSNGTSIRAHRIISTIEPTRLAALFGTWLPEEYREKMGTLEKVTAACLDVHLKRLPVPERTFAVGLDEPLYVSVHSEWARLTDDPDHAVVHVMKYEDGTNTDANGLRSMLEHWLDRVQPGWKQEAIWERFMPHVTVSYAKPVLERRGTLDRPDVCTGAPGLYAAGDWVGSDGLLLDASLASAKRAVRMVLSDKDQVGRSHIQDATAR